jgi:hypothetical protein
MQNLSMLLGDEDSFADMFQNTATDRNSYSAKPKKNAESNQIEFLMQNLKKFVFNGREHNYDNNDRIFFAMGPTEVMKAEKYCVSCENNFSSPKEICYCQFCGFGNCEKCLKKTRPFYTNAHQKKKAQYGSVRESKQLVSEFEDITHDDYDDKRTKQRGKICNLCCRRFHINTLFTTSFKQIEAYDLAITGTQAQSESGIKQLQKIDEENQTKLEREQIRIQ